LQDHFRFAISATLLMSQPIFPEVLPYLCYLDGYFSILTNDFYFIVMCEYYFIL
jgi:hypothetical protein